MCGIAGGIGVELTQKQTSQCLVNISQRGPDNSGEWRDPSNLVWIGHTRLSILDLSSASNQPLTEESGRYVFTYNGELYNYLELRGELSRRGIVFKTGSDTEVMFRGFIDKGISFLKKCNGMWAFFLWDRVTSTGYLCRDRFGVKPLYYSYSEAASSLLFCSEMKGLLPLIGKKELVQDFRKMIDNPFSYEGTEYCIYKGMRRLQAGAIATFSPKGLSVEKWWNTLEHIQPSYSSYSSQVDQWKDLFLDSTQLRLRSDVPIGVALSGGLDSSSIVATVSFLQPESALVWDKRMVRAYCSAFPGSSNDETLWARKVAESSNASLEVIQVNPSDISKRLLQDMAAVEDPYLTIPTPMITTYDAIQRSGIKISLEGHGSDELFSGYGHILQALRCSNRVGLLKEILMIEESTRTGVYSSYERTRLRNLVKERLIRSLRGGLKRLRVGIGHNIKGYGDYRDLLNEEVYSLYQDDRFNELDIMNQVLYEIFHLSFLPTLLRNYDRYSMSRGVETRMPFLDWRLVTYTFGLPWQAKVGGTFTKRVQRDAMEGLLIDEVRLRRDKIGWNAPLGDWLRNSSMEKFLRDIVGHCSDMKIKMDAELGLKQFYSGKAKDFRDGEKCWSQIQPAIWLEAQNLIP